MPATTTVARRSARNAAYVGGGAAFLQGARYLVSRYARPRLFGAPRLGGWQVSDQPTGNPQVTRARPGTSRRVAFGDPTKKRRNGTRTANRVVRAVRPPMHGPGKSGGFVRKPRRRVSKMVRGGINYTGEFGGLKTDADMAIIGHSCMPNSPVTRMIWLAVLKKVLSMAGRDVNDTTTAEFAYVAAGVAAGDRDRIKITFITQPGAAFNTETYGITNTDTLGDVVTWLCASSRAWNTQNAVPSASECEVRSLEYIPAGFFPSGTVQGSYYRYVKIKLFETSVTLTSKSTFKMQNRTVVTAGDEETAVNNVPINGKSYEGRGNGATWVDVLKYPTATFYGSYNGGIISQASIAVDLKEPPPMSEFKGVKAMGKIKLEPGEIKTSVLQHREAHTVSRWCKILSVNNIGPITHHNTTQGRFRFFCIEKMLDPTGSTNIQTAFEHNLAMTAMAKINPVQSTVQIYEAVRNLT